MLPRISNETGYKMVKDSFVDVASEMDSVMSSDEFKSIFSKPGQVKTASEKGENKKTTTTTVECTKDHDHKEDCMGANDGEDLEVSANSAIEVLISVSEALDEMGFEKSASVAIIAAETLIAEAKKKPAKKDKKDDKKDDKKKGKFPFFMKKDKKEDKEEGDKEDKKEDKKSSEKKK